MAAGEVTQKVFADLRGMVGRADADKDQPFARRGPAGGAFNGFPPGAEQLRNAVGLPADRVVHVIGMRSPFLAHCYLRFPFFPGARTSGTNITGMTVCA